MEIRPATSDDALILATILIDSWRSAYSGLVPDLYLDSMNYELRTEQFRHSLIEKNEETYIYEQNQKVAGFLTLGACRDSDLDHSKTGEIWGIYLSPLYWRKGIGTNLCRYGEQLLKSRGYKDIILWVFKGNSQAKSFYEIMGFNADGSSKILSVGVPLDAIRYRKNLELPNQCIY